MASSTCVVTTEEKQWIERNKLKTIEKRERNDSLNGSKKNMSQMDSKKWSSGRCCSCSITGTCLRCSCVMKGTPCLYCIPSRYGRCLNEYLASNLASDNESERSDGDGDGNELGRGLAMQKGVSCKDGDSIDLRPTLRSKMEKPFGGVMLNTNGGDSDDKWFCRWKQLVSLFGNLYDLPGGNVVKEFVGLLPDEISMLTEKRVNSERFIIFCRIVLQRDRLVKKGSDVRRLLKRRIDAWRNENFDELV